MAVHIAMSTKAHAKIVDLDLSPVRAAPGVVCVVAAADIPGKNDISPVMGDDPLFAEGVVEYAGQSLFAVGAETIEMARDAAALARIFYEDLPAVISIDEAMDQGSLLEEPYVMSRGDAQAAIDGAVHSLSGSVYVGLE